MSQETHIFYLGAVADRLTVRVEPAGIFPAAGLDFALRVVGDDGELAPFDGTWYADDAWQRTITATDAELYLVVTGDPGLYRIAVDRVQPEAAEPEPDSDVRDDASAISTTPRIATRNDGGCATSSGQPAAWVLVLAGLLLLLLLRRKRRT